MIDLRKVANEWRHALISALLALALVGPIGWWLSRPSDRGTIAVAARTGSLTLQVLCGEPVIWDLGPGKLLLRSAPPGTAAHEVERLTLTLNPGARVRVEASGAQSLRLAIERSEGVADSCGIADRPFYEASAGGESLENDVLGLGYLAAAAKAGAAARELTLVLSGHVQIGQAVQQGAGWAARVAGVLESGNVTLRVMPTFSHERVTLDTEQLDEGSLFDTHACLKLDEGASRTCPLAGAAPALGFFRTGEAALRVQVYARGPVGMQAYAGAEQQLLTVPNYISAWRSEVLRIWGALLTMVVAFWNQLIVLSRFVFRARTKGVRAAFREMFDSEGAAGRGITTNEAALDASVDSAKTLRTGGAHTKQVVLAIVCAGGFGLSPRPVVAEPVEIKQDTLTGSGYSFRRAGSCLVLTAQHVVKEIGVPIAVFDRTGAKAVGSRGYANDSYDLALVTLPDGAPVSCTTLWPDAAWLRRASLGTKSEFRVLRHYAGGKEKIIFLKYAGGDKDHFELAPMDATTVIESDSGSIVELDGKLAGIVQSVITESQRVRVLRMDRIDELVGERFRKGAAGVRAVSFGGVVFRGRSNPNWATYVQSWIAEKGGFTVLTPGASEPRPVCNVKVEVVSWDQVAVPNPERDSLEFQERACSKKGTIFESLCKQARAAKAGTPSTVHGQKLALNLVVTPNGGASVTRLVQSNYVPPSAKLTQSEIELAALQSNVASALPEMFGQAGCN